MLLLCILVTTLSVIVFADGKATAKNVAAVNWYSCAGKSIGNYMHPRNCTRYMACSEGGIANEMDCPQCHRNPENCPDGFLRWDDAVKRCEWANKTPCITADKIPQEPGSSSISKVPVQNGDSGDGSVTNPPLFSVPPHEGEPCEPTRCINWGYCQDYLRCDKSTKTWVKENCGQDLFWNTFNSNGKAQVHGGNCDIWDNLRHEVVAKYRNDPKCLACYWDTLGECEQDYLYQPPGGTSRNVLRMSCAKGLVFSLAKTTCQRCQDVSRADGTSCC